MPTKIKRCLFIGLGGTGMNAILKTKKMFVDAYGEVPPTIGFLGIDTDGGVYNKSLDSIRGEKVSLLKNEQMPITVEDAKPIYEVQKEHLSWIPQTNVRFLTSMMLGAGQIRTNGRFALTVNYSNLANKLQTVVNSVQNAQNRVNASYQLMNNNTEIHLVFSVGGGTGCGTFLDVAYLIRHLFPQSKLTGYAVLPDVFEAMQVQPRERIKPNAFGAIQDLDWLMHQDINSNPIHFDYVTEEWDTNDKPFNAVFVVDNQNKNGDVYEHVDQIADMISLALVTSAGELSGAAASVSDNLEQSMRGGGMDIDNKRAWAASLGVCEIIYRGEDLAHLFTVKAAQRLIARLFNQCEDTSVIVNNWIDSDEVHIRENNGNDHVIDFILPKNPPHTLADISDRKTPKPEVDAYIAAEMPKDADVDAKVKELTERVNLELHKLCVKVLNQECGIGALENVILGIQQQVNIFVGEMEEEKANLKAKEPQLENALNVVLRDLEDVARSFFKLGSTKDEAAQQVCNAAMALVVNRREQIRRDSALRFYNSLKQSLVDENSHLKAIKDRLVDLNRDFGQEISVLSNQLGKAPQTFQINLAQSSVNDVKVNDEELVMQDFLKSLGGEQLYDLGLKNKDVVKKAFEDFTGKLNSAKVWKNKSIDEVIDALSEEEFNELLRKAIVKSETLIRYNQYGYVPKAKPSDIYYVGVNDKTNSRLQKNNAFKNHLVGSIPVDFSSIGSRNHIIIYRQFGVFPAFNIGTLGSYEHSYHDGELEETYHFDAKYYLQMQRSDYALKPRKAEDDTLKLWVYGLVFGLIKYNEENGKYMLKNERVGQPLDDFWIELSDYRDQAYDLFKQLYKADARREFSKFIISYTKQKGAAHIEELLADVRANYKDKYSQINMTNEEIKAHGNEKVLKMFNEELTFAAKLDSLKL